MKLFTFKKGIHPAEEKQYTCDKTIETLPRPKEVFIPLSQHIGKPALPLVAKKDVVKKGQLIGQADGWISANVHASISGTVKAVGMFLHPMGSRVPMVHIIANEEAEEELLLNHPQDWKTASLDELKKIILDAGIVGLGGAAFPTHVKMSPPEDKTLDTFVLNGCECEPYLTCDHRMMVDEADRVLDGMAIIMKILQLKRGVIGIENNKPDAITTLKEKIAARGESWEVMALKSKYPQGAEKMLVSAALKRNVPEGGLPSDVGVVVNNVGTAMAIADAVIRGIPLTTRVVTVTGPGIVEPKNVLARIGDSFANAVEFCGGITDDTSQVFMGGPMMGMSQFDLNVPIVKATSGIVAVKEVAEKKNQIFPCIKCNACVGACPVNLLPNRLYRLTEKNMPQEAQDRGLMSCIECGSCVFVCPSSIPILQWIRIGKFKHTNSPKSA
ncbi:MAG: electron transport complex subunit RsxC [SAR324 cluster bacterium]|nr:electron transport complex subunit RsxC [SAR324 cluster bacterium]